MPQSPYTTQPTAPQKRLALLHTQPTAPQKRLALLHTQATAPQERFAVLHAQPTAPQKHPAVLHTQPTAPQERLALLHTQPTAPTKRPAVLHTQPTAPQERFAVLHAIPQIQPLTLTFHPPDTAPLVRPCSSFADVPGDCVLRPALGLDADKRTVSKRRCLGCVLCSPTHPLRFEPSESESAAAPDQMPDTARRPRNRPQRPRMRSKKDFFSGYIKYWYSSRCSLKYTG